MEIELLGPDGAHVTTVLVPPFSILPRAIGWGNRIFFAEPSGQYREGLVWVDPACSVQVYYAPQEPQRRPGS